MKIKIHNDGKGKHRSFEASIDGDFFWFSHTAFGEDSKEAVDNLKKSVTDMIESLQSIDWGKYDS